MQPEIKNQILHLFRDQTEEVVNLYRKAVDATDLDIVDYQTIHDLARLHGQTNMCLHMLLLAMFLARQEGSLCLRLERDNLIQRLAFLFDDRSEVERQVDLILPLLDTEAFHSIMTSDASAYFPLVRQGSFLYFQKFLHAERELANLLKFFLEKREIVPLTDIPTLADIFRTVLFKCPITVNGEIVPFNQQQQQAIGLALLKNFVIISGGPGTGKTSIVLNLIRCLVRCGIKAERIRLTAPTGRAAQHLTDSLKRGLDSIAPCSEKEGPDEQLETMAAMTIHRLLKYLPAKGRFVYNKYNHLPLSIVIIDEVSMVDVVLMTRLLEALDDSTRIVLIGDKDQLPSVEAGAVLADLMPRLEPTFSPDTVSLLKQMCPEQSVRPENRPTMMTDRVVVLHQSYRSEQSIQMMTGALNRPAQSDADLETIIDGINVLPLDHQNAHDKNSPAEFQLTWPQLSQKNGGWICPEGGCWRIPLENTSNDAIHAVLASWFDYNYCSPHFASGETYVTLLRTLASLDLDNDQAPPVAGAEQRALRLLFDVLTSNRILTFVRSSPFGCITANKLLCALGRERFGASDNSVYFHGMPVIVTRNDYEKQLFNGDVGIILKDKRSRMFRVFFNRANSFSSFAVSTMPAFEPAFAMTVHKSQGSEYGRLLVILPDDVNHRMLHRQIIYTALTRAKYLAVILGKRDVLLRAVETPLIRESGFDIWPEKD